MCQFFNNCDLAAILGHEDKHEKSHVEGYKSNVQGEASTHHSGNEARAGTSSVGKIQVPAAARLSRREALSRPLSSSEMLVCIHCWMPDAVPGTESMEA